MFGLWGDKRKKLEDKYQRLLAESFRLSKIDRKKSDEVLAEADNLRKQLVEMEESSQ